MRELTKEDIRIVDEFIKPYKDVLEDLMVISDTQTPAQQQAWRDYAVEKLVDELSLSYQQAKVWVRDLEEGNTKKHIYD